MKKDEHILTTERFYPISLPDRETLIRFANELVSQNFSPGIDNITSQSNLENFYVNGETIVHALNEGTYRPKPALLFSILKPNGNDRELSRCCAIDAVIQRALEERMNESLESFFSPDSYAFIRGKGRHAAVARVADLGKTYSYAAKIDPVSCFDNIDRELLFQIISRLWDSPPFLAILKKYAAMDVVDEKGARSRPLGILQGSPISPVLCNIYFSPLDQRLAELNIPFCRYADDVIVFAKDEKTVASYAETVMVYLTSKLKLRINTEKTRIGKLTDIAYLGFVFSKSEDGTLLAAEEKTSEPADYFDRWVAEKAKYNERPNAVNIVRDGILTRKDMTLAFESGDISTVLPIESIDQINIYGSVTMGPQMLQTAFKSGLRIAYFDRYGEKIGTFTPESPLKNVAVGLNQLEIYKDTDGLRLAYAKDFLLSQLHNLLLNLRYHRKQYRNEKCDDAVKRIEAIRGRVKNASKSDELLLMEAQARTVYYACLPELIHSKDFPFQKRTRRPPKDRVNALISFGNTFLYNYIAVEIDKTPLDIRIAFLHATTKRARSLNLDLADVYKPLIVDRTILKLVNKRQILPCHFVKEDNGAVSLTSSGKRILIHALYEKLSQPVPVNDGHKLYAVIIRDDVRSLCSDIKALRPHKSFRQVR